MASWSELQAEFPEKVKDNPNWLDQKLTEELGKFQNFAMTGSSFSTLPLFYKKSKKI